MSKIYDEALIKTQELSFQLNRRMNDLIEDMNRHITVTKTGEEKILSELCKIRDMKVHLDNEIEVLKTQVVVMREDL